MKGYERDRIFPVLDTGCGIGNFVDIFPNSFYVGVDFSLPALRELRNKYHKNVVLADVQNLPFKDNIFSFINAVEVLQYMDDHSRFLSEIARVSKKGAHVVIVAPNPSSLFWKIRQKIRGKSPLNFMNMKDLLSISKTLSLHNVDVFGIFLLPSYINLFVNMLLMFSFLNPLKLYIVMIFSKSYVVVFRKL